MQEKVVVVVGATGGIGSAVAHKLAKSGASLAIAARDTSRLDALANELPTEVLSVPCDITDPQQVEVLMQKTLSRFGQIDALVNVAGAGILKQWNKLEPADLDAMLDLNLKGSFYTSQAAANAIIFALSADPQAVPMEINIQPESHLFF
ncbi:MULTISPECIES: SDR family oxidoreductase [Kamptonema]|uniref:SDR family oxidoreductase n=1 Tax=Kamptonema TaxID=1501433 RepID=UPI0001DAD3CD